MPTCPDDRFPMNRTASIGSCVGPAVMSIRGRAAPELEREAVVVWASMRSSGEKGMVGPTAVCPDSRARRSPRLEQFAAAVNAPERDTIQPPPRGIAE
jgi:hypothetical protein